MTTANPSKFVKVRVEEVAIGALLGAGVGVSAVSSLAVGLDPPHLGLWGVLQATALGASVVAGACMGAWWAACQPRDSHVSGHKFVRDYHLASAALQAAQRQSFSNAQRAGSVTGIRIGGVELARSQEVRHAVCVGTTGAGKTALLNSIIEQALARGDRLIIHDPTGDFTERYCKRFDTVLLGPWDSRAAIWDAATDIGTPALADEFAQSTVGRVQGENKSFYDGAATVLAGLIKSYMLSSAGWTWPDLAASIAQSPQSIAAQAVAADPTVRTAVATAFRDGGDGLSNGDASKFSILSSATRWIRNYAAVDSADARRFSVVKWLLRDADKDVRIVLLNANAQYQSAGEAIFSSILSSAIAVLNSARMPGRDPDESCATWLMLDELPQLGKASLESLQKVSELGRARGLRVMLAMQDESQLTAVVGREKAAPMLAVQGTRIYTQCSPQTAEEVSRRVGERHINRIETTSENGALQGKSKRDVTERVIEPSVLTALHPRIHEPPLGVELVLHIGDVLGRLLQPFPERVPPEQQAPKLVESDEWRYGTLQGQGSSPTPPAVESGPYDLGNL